MRRSSMKKRYSRRSRKMRGGGDGHSYHTPPPKPVKSNGGSRKRRGGDVNDKGHILSEIARNKYSNIGGSRRSRKRRGGMPYGGPLYPQSYNGQGVGTSGVGLQFIAGNAA